MGRMPPTSALETDRLRLEPLALADAPALQRRFPRWEIVRHLSPVVPWPYPADGARVFVESALAEMAAGAKSHWTLRLKSGQPDEAIGVISLWRDGLDPRDNRGFWLDPRFQRRGLMTEAADRVVDYAFDDLGWSELWFSNARDNRASARVKERQGAQLVAEVAGRFVEGEGVRQIWRLEAEAWRARRAGRNRA